MMLLLQNRQKMNPELKKHYGSLFEPELLQQIDDVSTLLTVVEGTALIKPGQYIRSMPLLLSGSIKIMRADEQGNELLLYYLEKGDTCAMTMSCCMGTTKSEIHAITETPTEVLMIPIIKMEEWSSKYKTWRNFVFSSYHDRMMELLESLDNIAFNNMNERLGNYLKDKVAVLGSQHIHATHREIAADLNTSRVVISRLLKNMENNNLIELHRNFIKLL